MATALATKKIPQHILAILSAAVYEGCELTLVGQLDRKDYVATNDVLTQLGGKWVSKKKAHVFPSDVSDIMESVLLTGEVIDLKALGTFFTPPSLAEEVVEFADIEAHHTVLEPSAGDGRIAVVVARTGARVDCIEINGDNAARIMCQNFASMLTVGNFLEQEPLPLYDRVVMNPPFAKQADIDHVTHAMKFLKPDTGTLTAIMSAGIKFRQDKKTKAFRELLDKHAGQIHDLAEGAFKSSGTMVNTVIVRMVAKEHQHG